MKKISMQFILRIIAIIVFIGGAFIGYDVGDKMVTINHVISYQFSVIDALIVSIWCCTWMRPHPTSM